MLETPDEEGLTPTAASLHDKDELENPGIKPEGFPDWENSLENPRNWPAWKKSILMAAMSASAITGYSTQQLR
jgi:hypothetical protein